MFLQEHYLGELYRFINVESSFMPHIKDGNKARLKV